MPDAGSQSWPHVKKEKSTDADPENLGDLLRLMRNGIAHGNIEFLPDKNNEISAIRLWNKRGQCRTWGTILTIKSMRELLNCFVELAEQLHEQNNRNEDRVG